MMLNLDSTSVDLVSNLDFKKEYNTTESLKKDLIVQMTNTGEYHMPDVNIQQSSAIKSIIAAQISFINT